MGERKWEDIKFDCLLNILQRVGIESLLVDVPFVCKSWYKATLSPSCWKFLVFPQDQSYHHFIARFMETYRLKSIFKDAALVKLVIDRSQNNATLLHLPYCATEKELKYAADKCPALKTLDLTDLSIIVSRIIPELIGNWKNLEALKLGSSNNLTEILAAIRLNCNNFEGLCIYGGDIDKDEAMAIINNLPNIKYMSLKGTILSCEGLEILLLGCKQLLLLDVRDCTGFDCDQKILDLASHINNFMHDHEFSIHDFEADYNILDLASHVKYFTHEGSKFPDYDDGGDYYSPSIHDFDDYDQVYYCYD